MQDNQKSVYSSDVMEELAALLEAHRCLCAEHTNVAAHYRHGRLTSFREGVEVPNVLAAEEHEEQARVSEYLIKELEGALSGMLKPPF